MPAALILRCQVVGGVGHGLERVAAADGHDDHLVRGQGGRQHEALVVAVGHDHGADHAGAHAPRRGVAELLDPGRVRVLDAEGLGEVGAEEVRGAGLQRLAVAHHALDGVGPYRAGEPLPRGLLALDDRDRRDVAGERLVEVERHQRLAHRVGLVDVGGVALLPEELRGAQEHPRPQLPPHDVGPLVEQQRQVAVAGDPLGHELADDGLGRRPYDRAAPRAACRRRASRRPARARSPRRARPRA